MFKKLFLVLLTLSLTPCAMAQEVFWGFDEDNKELIVPPECDNTTDAQELYDIGMRLLEETGYAKQGAAYCLVAAALDNHSDAQYQVANLYHRGILLPKSDLAAYKWATLAALNGNMDADLLGANLEQFLSIEDIEVSTRSLESLIPIIAEANQKEMEAEIAKQAKIKAEIKIVKQEVRDLKQYGRMRPRPKKVAQSASSKESNDVVATVKNSVASSAATSKPTVSKAKRPSTSKRAKPGQSIFSDADLANAPMPSAY